MPRPLLFALFIIFLVHFFIFLRLSVLRKKVHHILATISFFLLIMFSSTRLWEPRMMLYGHWVYNYFRYSAWCTSAVTFSVYVWKRGKNPK
jgi:hypothetical protein